MNAAPGAPSKTAQSKSGAEGRRGGDREGGMKITVGRGLANGFFMKVSQGKTSQQNEEKLIVELKTLEKQFSLGVVFILF